MHVLTGWGSGGTMREKSSRERRTSFMAELTETTLDVLTFSAEVSSCRLT
jgi:hypothetical protein